NEQRVQEYGTAGHPDYNGRGTLATAYTSFVLNELRPFAAQQYQASLDPAQAVVAGFSLGGLSALDMAWHHPEAFARAGAFSGSFWWRQKAVGAGYTPADRIMHQLVRARRAHPSHRFWLQAGTLDEKNDRNENGVIDSIEDCLDLIGELIRSGLNPYHALRYVQVEGGHHHPTTWGHVLPDFLRWAFGTAAGVSSLAAPLPVVRLQLDPHLAPALILPNAAPPTTEPAPMLLPDSEVSSAPDTVEPPAAPIFPMSPHLPHMSHIRPAEGDYLPYALGYINQIPAGHDPLAALRTQPAEVHTIFGGLSEAQAEKPYAEGKWTLKEMLLHQIDSERVFAYRALRFARADGQDLRGFEQDDYVAHSQANGRTVASLLAEYDSVRAATVSLFETFGEAELSRRGSANGGPASVRALLYIIPGHERHHLNIIRERYLPVI
ncbi:MAG: alpha/beta hydrolase-fold protein, partial [Bacteroidota bacterium]|nr:alpha/beta hydrolase-fold protein [Bacteroidota bacterium]